MGGIVVRILDHIGGGVGGCTMHKWIWLIGNWMKHPCSQHRLMLHSDHLHFHLEHCCSWETLPDLFFCWTYWYFRIFGFDSIS